MQVRSAVIPAAGMGTRFLPASKAIPKELLPIGDTPTLQLVIDEALGAGIEHIVIVSSQGKPAVEAYFQPSPEIIASLEASGKTDLAERMRSIGRDWKVTIAPGRARGLGAPSAARGMPSATSRSVLAPPSVAVVGQPQDAVARGRGRGGTGAAARSVTRRITYRTRSRPASTVAVHASFSQRSGPACSSSLAVPRLPHRPRGRRPHGGRSAPHRGRPVCRRYGGGRDRPGGCATARPRGVPAPLTPVDRRSRRRGARAGAGRATWSAARTCRRSPTPPSTATPCSAADLDGAPVELRGRGRGRPPARRRTPASSRPARRCGS